MPSLEDNALVFRFPDTEPGASIRITFKRTLRIPDTDKTYNLPPGLGSFPLRHTEDYASALSSEAVERGGLILPMWQAEAMWIKFDNDLQAEGAGDVLWRQPRLRSSGLSFPVAIKVAAGKINAVSGEPWRPGLHRQPQDYMVSPRQPWLDGYAIEPSLIRQFVAMPLGEGYTAEEQITGQDVWGGLQISVTPLKAAVWNRMKQAALERDREAALERDPMAQISHCRSTPRMLVREVGLSPGGRMKQKIFPDSQAIDDWDIAAADRVFVTLVHAKDWKGTTGEPALPHPPSAKDYSRLGLPWFDYYENDRRFYPPPQSDNPNALSRLKSVGALFKTKTGTDLPDSEDVITQQPIVLGPSSASRPVKSGEPEA